MAEWQVRVHADGDTVPVVVKACNAQEAMDEAEDELWRTGDYDIIAAIDAEEV